MNSVLDRVVNAALRLTDADEGSILFYEEASDEFLPEALMSSGIGQPLHPYQTKTRQRSGLAYKIVRERIPVVITDTKDAPQVSQIAIEKGRRAMVGVPLIDS